MTDDILVGTNAGLTVGEAACPDDAVVFGATNPNDEDKSKSEGESDERANQSLAAFAREADQ